MVRKSLAFLRGVAVKRRICVFVALFVACMVAVAGAPATFGSDQPAAVAKAVITYRNPVVDGPFPDPYVLRGPNGWYYAYATQGIADHVHINIPVQRSQDLVHWTYVGDALPHLPSWGNNSSLSWAPHVIGVAGRYYLYYSIIPDSLQGRSQPCLAVATSGSPTGPFVTTSKPLYCGATLGSIDPAVFNDAATGHWRLFWHYGGGIAEARLAPSLTSRASTAPPIMMLKRSDTRPYEKNLESPFVIGRDGWYYLYYSGDKCCTYPPHYATMVARSRSAVGPYQRFSVTRPGASSVILHSNLRWAGPGGSSVIRDKDGQDWIVYHAIDTGNRYNPGSQVVRRVMLIDRIFYTNGWPTIATNSPSTIPMPVPITN
jgi:arabinan endo-1,5-alpha-L-arabinosidase